MRRDQAGVRAVAASLRTRNVLALETATGLLLQTTGGGTDVGQPYVATPALLARYGIGAGLGLLGALLGTCVASLAAIAYFRSQLSAQLLNHLPVPSLILILAGLPAIAAAGGWLLAGREPRAIARQPIE